MDKKVKEGTMGIIISLIGIMEETTDPSTKDRLNEQISELMQVHGLNWDDM
ncbi:hypothetical protein ACO1B2_10355 [Staphylococcus saprophyticus]|uniref:hypothetical protein n=1 Tax=Staphylococcus saprophyticus TaxID=29385 RepID=UPI003BF6577F